MSRCSRAPILHVLAPMHAGMVFTERVAIRLRPSIVTEPNQRCLNFNTSPSVWRCGWRLGVWLFDG